MFYNVILSLARFLFFFGYRLIVIGRENIPADGALVCANHTALNDPIFGALALGNKNHMRFMAKAELFQNPLLGGFLRRLGAFPVHRGKADIAAIKESLAILKSGGKLMLFPEGRRVLANEMEEAKTGAGMLALRSGVQVLPVFISDQKRLFSRVYVVIGRPYRAAWEGKPGHDAYQAVADDIMARVEGLREEIPR